VKPLKKKNARTPRRDKGLLEKLAEGRDVRAPITVGKVSSGRGSAGGPERGKEGTLGGEKPPKKKREIL